MTRTRGFTLIELLVVIAIITILATIAIPRVTRAIEKARIAKAISEIRSMEGGLRQMLMDADKKDFRSFFTFPGAEPATVAEAVNVYTNAFYLLLGRGRHAPNHPDWPVALALKEGVQEKLAEVYMNVGKDSWGNLYQFHIGPWRSGAYGLTYIPFRSHGQDEDVPGAPVKNAPEDPLPTNAPPPAQWPEYDNYPARSSEDIYIWSWGGDEICSQKIYPDGDGYHPDVERTDPYDYRTDTRGGGDDINNWDNTGSWREYY